MEGRRSLWYNRDSLSQTFPRHNELTQYISQTFPSYYVHDQVAYERVDDYWLRLYISIDIMAVIIMMSQVADLEWNASAAYDTTDMNFQGNIYPSLSQLRSMIIDSDGPYQSIV